MKSGVNLWRLEEAGCMGSPLFWGNSDPNQE
jgi:hypothetical protein